MNGGVLNSQEQFDFIASVTQTLSEELRDIPGLRDASAQDYYSAITEVLGRRFTASEFATLSEGALTPLQLACMRYFELPSLPNDRLQAAVRCASNRWS